MSHTLVGKLNDDAREFTAGDSVGFGFRIGERYYDRETQQSAYTNYEGALFFSNPQQIQFARDTFKKGAVIAVTCAQLKIKKFISDNGTEYLTNEMLQCRMDNVFYDAVQQGQGQPQGQQQYGAQQQQHAQPTTYSPQTPAGAPQLPPMPQSWNDYQPTPKANGKTMQQIYSHPQIMGDLGKAVGFGWLVIDDGDSIPF